MVEIHDRPTKVSKSMVRLPGLRQQRRLRRLSIADLALRSGCWRPAVAAADRGDPVSVKTAEKIIKALELVPVSEVALAVFGEASG